MCTAQNTCQAFIGQLKHNTVGIRCFRVVGPSSKARYHVVTLADLTFISGQNTTELLIKDGLPVTYCIRSSYSVKAVGTTTLEQQVQYRAQGGKQHNQELRYLTVIHKLVHTTILILY